MKGCGNKFYDRFSASYAHATCSVPWSKLALFQVLLASQPTGMTTMHTEGDGGECACYSTYKHVPQVSALNRDTCLVGTTLTFPCLVLSQKGSVHETTLSHVFYFITFMQVMTRAQPKGVRRKNNWRSRKETVKTIVLLHCDFLTVTVVTTEYLPPPPPPFAGKEENGKIEGGVLVSQARPFPSRSPDPFRPAALIAFSMRHSLRKGSGDLEPSLVKFPIRLHNVTRERIIWCFRGPILVCDAARN